MHRDRLTAIAFVVALCPAHAYADPPLPLDAESTRAFIEARLAQLTPASDDPHVLLLGALQAFNDDGSRGALPYLERALELAPDDPVVLLHLDKYCRQAIAGWDGCADNDWPMRIARLAPENGAPWLRIAALASDDAARRDALFEAAERPYYDSHYGQNAYRMYEALHRLAPSGRSLHAETVATFALGIAAAGINYEVELVRACRDGTEVRIAHLCRRVANQMVDHARTMIGVSVASHHLTSLPTLTDGERVRLDRSRASLERLARHIETEPDLWTSGTSAEQSMHALATVGEWRMWLQLAADR